MSKTNAMEKCYYATVDTISPGRDGDTKITKKYIMRQLFICSGIYASYFAFGLSYGSPTVLIPQIRREANSTDAVSMEMTSWLSAAFNYSGLVSAVFLAFLARLVGRKLCFLFVCGTAVISYIIFYCSKTVTQILISEIILGPLVAAPTTVSIMILTEYTSPKYRGVFLTLKSAMFLWGIWVSNIIGTFFHWKNIGIFAFICIIYSFLSAFMWPESPYWLVTKNRFDDSAASHRWLKGKSEESEAELEALLASRNNVKERKQTQNVFRKAAKMLGSKSFYKPILMGVLVLTLYVTSGKIPCGMYAIDIFKRITQTESIAYMGMLILDGITILGMYFGCSLSKILKRRTLLLVSATIGIAFLFCISFYLYLTKLEIISEDAIISISLLTGYSLLISVGPLIMATTILGELIPIKHRSSAVLFLGCIANLLMGTAIKITPFILDVLGAHGMFLFFGICASVCTFITYKVLPETKDQSLIEIQENLLSPGSNSR